MCQSFGACGAHGSMLFFHFCEIGIHVHTMKSACSTQDSQPDGEIVQSQGQKHTMIFSKCGYPCLIFTPEKSLSLSIPSHSRPRAANIQYNKPTDCLGRSPVATGPVCGYQVDCLQGNRKGFLWNKWTWNMREKCFTSCHLSRITSQSGRPPKAYRKSVASAWVGWADIAK